jgi:PST family polysaccharide transporter
VVRALGPANFGLVAFSQSFAQYFTLLINFGFDLSAVREYASAKNDEERQAIFNNVLTAKALLFSVSLLLFIGFSSTVPSFRENSTLHLCCFLFNIGSLLYQSWFFQAAGIMVKSVVINMISRLLMAVGLLLLVKEPEDFILFGLLFSASQVLLGVASITYIFRRFKFRFAFSFAGAKKQLKNGMIIFVSSIMIALYTNTNVFLLGMLSTKEATGYFSSASKIIYGCVYLIFVPFSLLLYPVISAAMKTDQAAGINILRRSVWLALFIGGTISFFLFVFARPLVLLLYGSDYTAAIIDFRILSLLPLLLALSNIFVTQGMLNLGMDRHFFSITMIGAVVCLVINFVFIPYFHDVAASVALVVTEGLITLISCYLIKKRIGVIIELSDLKSMLLLAKQKLTGAGIKPASH